MATRPLRESAVTQSRPALLRSKMFWVGLLYLSEGFPLGFFYDIFPVHFRQQGVELWEIGFMSLLGLAWTLKFLWAPAVDHYRHHRRWMVSVDLAMGMVLLAFAVLGEFGPWAWFAVGAFTLLSATNDIAIDGYTIELLEKRELGLANGIRIGMYRVGMLLAGFVLILSDWLGWAGTYLSAAGLFLLMAAAISRAPRERTVIRGEGVRLGEELAAIARQPWAAGAVWGLLAGALWLVDRKIDLAQDRPWLWPAAFAAGALWVAVATVRHRSPALDEVQERQRLREGPMFGALMEMLTRPGILPVIAFILLFKLGDAAMGFMVKPFWVDAGFSATQIGLVSVNIGLVLSIAGGVAGGWITDRIGIFRGLWVLGLFQALSNLGYAGAAWLLPLGSVDGELTLLQQGVMYGASAVESFTGGLGTAAFLAFLMAIVDRRRAATEYALLSSIFALSRSLAGWAGGFGAHDMGYANWFLVTFFLSFPAYLLLPWVRRMLGEGGREA
ncbi:MAG TPA: MFS transporter [Thiotrichales bacterium]|nr:MFS transporter [Thiotrichales bacterium]